MFGEKQGLLDAAAEHVLATFVADKAARTAPDPVEDLRVGWVSYIAFGLANPAVFEIINEIGAPTSGSSTSMAGVAVSRARVERVARAGRLRVPVERAVRLIHAAGHGTVATLIATAEAPCDPYLSPSTRDAVLSAILVSSPTPGKEQLANLGKCATPAECPLMGRLIGLLQIEQVGLRRACSVTRERMRKLVPFLACLMLVLTMWAGTAHPAEAGGVEMSRTKMTAHAPSDGD